MHSFPYSCLGAYLTFGGSRWELFRRGGGDIEKKNAVNNQVSTWITKDESIA